MPAPLNECRPVFDQIQAIFTGEFDKIIVQPNGVSNYVFVDKEIVSKAKIPGRGLSELDRLSYVVNQVDSDCQLVPRGALKMTPLRELRKNEAFRGLKLKDAKDVNNYFHFRAPLLKKNVELNQRREGIYNNDFLDNAGEDLPSNNWSVISDTIGTVAVLRSKLWPGYYFYHKTCSDIYGGLYVGNGCKNLDVAFMF